MIEPKIIDYLKFVGVFGIIHLSREAAQKDCRIVLLMEMGIMGISTSDFATARNGQPKPLENAKAKAVEAVAEDFLLLHRKLLELGTVYLTGVVTPIAFSVLKNHFNNLFERTLSKILGISSDLTIVFEQMDAHLFVVKGQGNEPHKYPPDLQR